MNKKLQHQEDFKTLLLIYWHEKNINPLIDYFCTNSNLPGPRANLEMALGWGDAVEEALTTKNDVQLLLNELKNFDLNHKPTGNEPNVMIPFCYVIALGAVGKKKYGQFIFDELINYSNDKRWRIREAVAHSFAEIVFTGNEKILSDIQNHSAPTPLEMRGFCAGFADMRIVDFVDLGEYAIQLHYKALDILKESSSPEEKKVLSQALGYTLSVCMLPVPQMGFNLIKDLLQNPEKVFNQIGRENLIKNRLRKRFPEDVELLLNTFLKSKK